MNIYLLRHGETNWNLEGRMQGQRDVMMNEKGISQIREAGESLAVQNAEIDVIISSPLTRARRSAEIVADRLGYPLTEILTEPLFAERSFGDAEGMIYREVENELRENRFANVESVEALYERAGKAFQKTIQGHEEKNILIVAHGGILKALLAAVTDRKITYEVPVANFNNGSLFLLKYEAGQVEIFNYNKETENYEKVIY